MPSNVSAKTGEVQVQHGRIVVVGYTPRGADRHVFSMRKANDREKARIAQILGF